MNEPFAKSGASRYRQRMSQRRHIRALTHSFPHPLRDLPLSPFVTYQFPLCHSPPVTLIPPVILSKAKNLTPA